MINLEDILILKKGGIHIKPENRGKFTEYCGGKVTEECIRKGKNSPNPLTRKRAAFAGVSRTWKHENGGIIDGWNWLKDIFGLNDNLNRWYVGSSKKGNEVKYMSTKEFRDLYRPDPKKEKSIVSETKQDPIINSAIIPIIENGDTTFVDPYGNQVPKERYYAQPKYIDDTQWELNQQHKQNQKKVLKSFYKYRNGGGIPMFQKPAEKMWGINYPGRYSTVSDIGYDSEGQPFNYTEESDNDLGLAREVRGTNSLDSLIFVNTPAGQRVFSSPYKPRPMKVDQMSPEMWKRIHDHFDELKRQWIENKTMR